MLGIKTLSFALGAILAGQAHAAQRVVFKTQHEGGAVGLKLGRQSLAGLNQPPFKANASALLDWQAELEMKYNGVPKDAAWLTVFRPTDRNGRSGAMAWCRLFGDFTSSFDETFTFSADLGPNEEARLVLHEGGCNQLHWLECARLDPVANLAMSASVDQGDPTGGPLRVLKPGKQPVNGICAV